MAIRAVYGVPDSGKTYISIKFILDRYCIKVGNDYRVKEPFKIITNINGFNHKGRIINADKTVRYYDGHTIINRMTREDLGKFQYLVIVLDEAQMYMPMDWRAEVAMQEFGFYLQYHAHFKQDIWLLSQNRTLLRENYLKLISRSYVCARPALRIIRGRMKYYPYVSGVRQFPVGVKLDKNIFDFYISDKDPEQGKEPSPFVIPLVLFILCAMICAGLFFYLKSNFFGGKLGGNPQTKTEEKKLKTNFLSEIKAEEKLIPLNFVQTWGMEDKIYSVYVEWEKELIPLEAFPEKLQIILSKDKHSIKALFAKVSENSSFYMKWREKQMKKAAATNEINKGEET